MKHIFIEGPDGAGKTALARLFCRTLGMDYNHEGPPPPGVRPFEHYWMTLTSIDHPTVFDRFHLGEIVYAPLLRGHMTITPNEVRLLNTMIFDMGGDIILCLPPWETCFANTKVKQELINDDTVMRAAYDGWKVLSQNDELFAGRVYDYTQEGRNVA